LQHVDQRSLQYVQVWTIELIKHHTQNNHHSSPQAEGG
jgi:hypothetical protein